MIPAVLGLRRHHRVGCLDQDRLPEGGLGVCTRVEFSLRPHSNQLYHMIGHRDEYIRLWQACNKSLLGLDEYLAWMNRLDGPPVYLPTCLPAYLPTCLPTYLHTHHSS